ncbi:MAG: ribosomal protein S18-alanine N-acetyltransferase [bacterium]
MKTKIRIATLEDIENIAEIEKVSFPSPWSKELIREEILFPLSLNLVATINGLIVGYVLSWLIPPEVHILNLAVDPKHRNKGVGRIIIETLFEEASKKGATKFTLEVRNGNVDAICFYQRFGFLTKGVRKGYYQDTGEDALIMWKEVI